MAQHRGEKVQEIKADLFAYARSNYALAHCVGADLKMGKGIAVEFKHRFGHQQYLLDQGKVPGQVAVLPGNMCNREAPIFYLVSKALSYSYGPRWQDFVSCLQELRQLCEQMGIKYVAMPRIGCYNDHLEWCNVEAELYRIFQFSPVSVFVFTPPVLPTHRFPDVHVGEPSYKGFQLLGDSQMLRFSQTFGSYQQQPRERFPRRLGLCLSGQRMKSLQFIIQPAQLHHSVIVLIGTNDVLQLYKYGGDFRRAIRHTLRTTVRQLGKTLASRCTRVIVPCIPPVPAHAECTEHVVWLNGLIEHLPKFHANIQVVKWTENMDVSFFESVMGPPGNQRQDLIHLNYRGLELLKTSLDQSISSFPPL
ncbi:uncharacterized protein LOC117639073 [Thrips palmi]|uniref:Uncharacterized protein LOC117639073 n=1 Tax=Thrips palmi TaxID=161013 RepID=A0A6P8Y2T7_THRPL|nr:uncharacterized protein LOC117639073 [Thrips palmi]